MGLSLKVLISVWAITLPVFAQGKKVETHDKNKPGHSVNGSVAPQIKISWDKVNRTGFVKELIADAGFKRLPLDLRWPEAQGDLSLQDVKSILDLPIVKAHIGDFVKEAIIGESNLNFSFNPDQFSEIIKEILNRLVEKKEIATAKDFIRAVTLDAPLERLKYEGMLASLTKGKTPALQTLIKTMAAAKEVRIIHTTREVPPTFKDKPVVPGFSVFPSGRFGVSFKDSQGVEKYIVIQTEDKVGHLQPVIPGKTVIDGYIAEAKDGDFDKLGTQFTDADMKTLLATLVSSWGTPDKISDDKRSVLLSVAAVYANGDQGKLERALAGKD